MSEKKQDSGFAPAPHTNAAVHEKIMKASADDIAKTAVAAGIYTAKGKLTKHYAPTSKK